MAVYTALSRGDIEGFLSRYRVGRLLEFSGIEDGIENSNYAVTTTQGRFVLTLFEKRVSPADLPYFTSLMDHLGGAGLPVAPVIRDENGQTVTELKGKAALLAGMLEGRSRAPETPLMLTAVGQLLAAFHERSASMVLRRKNDLAFTGWQALVDACGSAHPYQKLIRAELDAQATMERIDLPEAHCHLDMFPDNLLWQKGEISGVIDFYFAAWDTRAYDLAITLNAWCFDGGHFNRNYAKALIEGYENTTPLNALEKKQFPALCRGAALRFLLTRLYDALHQSGGVSIPRKDPEEYAARLVWHQNKDFEDYA